MTEILKRGRGQGRKWKKGESGNKAGRPPGQSLAAMARAATRSRDKSGRLRGPEGKGVIEFWGRVYRGEEVTTVDGEDFKPAMKDRLEASKLLVVRGWGEEIENADVDAIRADMLEHMRKELDDATARLKSALADTPDALERALAALAGGVGESRAGEAGPSGGATH